MKLLVAVISLVIVLGLISAAVTRDSRTISLIGSSVVAVAISSLLILAQPGALHGGGKRQRNPDIIDAFDTENVQLRKRQVLRTRLPNSRGIEVTRVGRQCRPDVLQQESFNMCYMAAVFNLLRQPDVLALLKRRAGSIPLFLASMDTSATISQLVGRPHRGCPTIPVDIHRTIMVVSAFWNKEIEGIERLPAAVLSPHGSSVITTLSIICAIMLRCNFAVLVTVDYVSVLFETDDTGHHRATVVNAQRDLDRALSSIPRGHLVYMTCHTHFQRIDSFNRQVGVDMQSTAALEAVSNNDIPAASRTSRVFDVGSYIGFTAQTETTGYHAVAVGYCNDRRIVIDSNEPTAHPWDQYVRHAPVAYGKMMLVFAFRVFVEDA